MSVTDFIPYIAAWIVVSAVMHFYNGWMLSSRAGIARFRSLLPVQQRAKLSDAQLLGKLRTVHASGAGWMVDVAYAAGIAAGSFAGSQMSQGYSGSVELMRFIGAFVVVGTPILALAEWLRRRVYRRELARA